MDKTDPADRDATSTRAHAARARARAAGNLLNTEQFAEALPLYDWLWRHLHHEAPDMAGVRVSFLAGEMGQLCRSFPPAQAHFERLRDDSEAALASGVADTGGWQRLDWMVLNEIVGQADRGLLWFDGIDVAALADDLIDACIPRLVPLLRRRGRWAEIGQLFRHPLEKLRADHVAMVEANASAATRRGFAGMSPVDLRQDLFREQTRVVYRGLCAAGRAAEAEALRDCALQLDDTPAMREALTIEPG